MDTLQRMGFFIILLGVLVAVHEFGHFLVAKLLNVKVLKFSIGFGPRVFGFRRGETEYQLAWIPLGGYVKMAGEQPQDELTPEEAARGFLAQAPWRRALIVAAGPVFNLVFPILVYFFVFLGAHEEVSTRIGSVEPGLPAAAAGLLPGDRIEKIDGEAVRTFDELKDALKDSYDREIVLTVERDGKSFVTKLTPTKTVETNPVSKVTRGLIGISPSPKPPVLGVPKGSAAEAAGLRTHDRVLSINGKPVKDELALKAMLAGVEGPLELEVSRAQPLGLPGAPMQAPSVVKVQMERQPGELYAALGAERGELYVGSVVDGSSAKEAGLVPGDRLLELDGQTIHSWLIFQYLLREVEGRPFTLKWRSGQELKSATVSQRTIEVQDELKQTSEVLDLGLRPNFAAAEATEAETITLHMGASEAMAASLKIVPEIIGQTALVIGRLFTGGVSFKQVGGPLMLYDIAAKTAERGLDSFLQAMAILSINLGLMNLLPIPILDGFHLVAAAWESVRRRPIPIRAREIANMVGLVLLVVLMVAALGNDISRYFR